MKITIELDDKRLYEMIAEAAANQVSRGEYEYEIRKHISEAVKEAVYSRKNELIDRAVDQAAKELVRKGMPKLLQTIKEGE